MAITIQQEVKIPPQNLEAEKSVLGSMLIDDNAIGLALEILDESYFYDESHKRIFAAILDLYNNHKNVDLITLCDKLKSDGVLESIGGVSYLTQIIDFVPTSLASLLLPSPLPLLPVSSCRQHVATHVFTFLCVDAIDNRPAVIENSPAAAIDNRPAACIENRPAAIENRPAAAIENRPAAIENSPATFENRQGVCL